MERGFKSRCEEISRHLRVEIGLAPGDSLTVTQLADYLDVSVWSVSDLGLHEEDLRQLVEVDADSWSAIIVSASGRDMVIYKSPRPHQNRLRRSSADGKRRADSSGHPGPAPGSG